MRKVRERIGHPAIDGEGHLIEMREAVVRFVRDGVSASFPYPGLGSGR